MRAIRNSVTAALLGLMLVPGLAAASDIEAEIEAMKAQLANMEERLDATSDQLAEAEATVEEQQVILEESGIDGDRDRGSFSAISTFIESTEIDSWLATSYNYNFENHSPTQQVGGNPSTGGFHTTSNTFQFDQAGISISKAPTDESRAGMQLEFLYGVGAGGLPGGVFLANVSYLLPLLEGLQTDAGILPTRLGMEVAETNANWNITRGATWSIQPVTNTGFITDLAVTEAINVAFGVLNDPFATTTGQLTDLDSNKTLTAQAGYSGEKFSVLTAILWGRNSLGFTADVFGAGGPGVTNAGSKTGLFDAIVSLDPTDNLSLYLNYDYRWDQGSTGFVGAGAITGITGTMKTHGVSAAARLQIIDNTGLAIRGEYLTSTVAGLDFYNAWTITGTLDQKLTDSLTGRVEVRGEGANGTYAGGGGLLPGKAPGTFITAGAAIFLQAMYQF